VIGAGTGVPVRLSGARLFKKPVLLIRQTGRLAIIPVFLKRFF
jgi:hypothetical protein